MPGISAPYGWVITSDLADKTRLSMEDASDDDFYLSASLAVGVAQFGLTTELPGKRSPIRGEELFLLMVEHFGPANILVLRGRWFAIPGVTGNLDTFNRLTAQPSPFSEEEAARKTFTGKMAERTLGFTGVTFATRRGSPGSYPAVVVDFTPP